MNRNEDFSENPNYNVGDLPLLASHEYLPTLPNYHELVHRHPNLIHWHPDFEFIMVTDGIIDFCVNEKKLRIKRGQGLFVNSNRLHFSYSDEKSPVRFELLLIHPRLIETPCNHGELSVLCDDKNTDYILFDNGSELWEILGNIMEAGSGQPEIFGLQAYICRLVRELSAACRPDGCGEPDSVRILRKMLEFVKKHYNEKITVSDISKAGAVGRSTCFSLFREYMNVTPQHYLIQFRMSKGAEFLLDNISVAKTSRLCGFATQSHFTKVFHDIYGVTPKEYQNHYRNQKEIFR